MSKTEDNTPIDNELKAYLAGEDGVSAAYRQTGAEEPPAELDRLILAAARNAVKQHTPRKLATLQQRLPLAASFMVGVLITSMYFNQADKLAGSAKTSDVAGDQVVSQSVELPAVSAPAPAPAAATVASEEEAQELMARDAVQQAEQSPPQTAGAATQETRAREQTTAQASQDQPLPPQTGAPRITAPQEAQTPAANDTAGNQNQPLAGNSAAAQSAPAVESPAPAASAVAAESAAAVATTAGTLVRTNERQLAGVAAPPAIPADFEKAREESDEAGALEEIQITGSRIRAEDDLAYRESQAAWLERILALGEEILFQTDALEQNNSALEEEMKLFSETYPDVDLEAELQGLEAE